MDPKHMEWMSKEVQNGTFYCAQMEVILHNMMIKKSILKAL
jgi:hypothetical protein